MTRLTKEQLEEIKKKYNVERLWSYSRLSLFLEQPWCYRIKYLEKQEIDDSNVWTLLGGAFHDLLEDFYNGKIEREEIFEKYEDIVSEYNLEQRSKYPFMSESVENSFFENLEKYFQDFSDGKIRILSNEITPEKPLVINVSEGSKNDNVIFIGYADLVYKDIDENYHIVDFKTSSKSGFTGKKLKEKSAQLMLYALGLHQELGVPFNKIKLEYDMMKYVSVSYLQKNGKWKTTLQERSNWAISQEAKIRKALLDNNYDVFKINDYIDEVESSNSLDGLPENIRSLFKVDYGKIEVDFEEEDIEELKINVFSAVQHCVEKESKDWDLEFPEPILDSNDFYFKFLAPGFLKFHKTHQEKQKLKEIMSNGLELDEIDFLFM